jgi:hypothetical protein
MTWPSQSNWDGLGWVGPQSEGKVTNKCSAYVGTPSRRLEKHSSWSWLRECQECAKLSSRLRVALEIICSAQLWLHILLSICVFWLPFHQDWLVCTDMIFMLWPVIALLFIQCHLGHEGYRSQCKDNVLKSRFSFLLKSWPGFCTAERVCDTQV